MIQTSLTLLIRDNKIMLGIKKRGFGMGRLNGAGGKLEFGETPKDAAIRETYEEVGIKINSLEKVATIVFDNLYYKGIPSKTVMHVFLSDDFEGEAIESDEIQPTWHDIFNIPYDKMWIDDKYWLPRVLAGKKINAYFLFNETDTFTDYWIEELNDYQITELNDEILGVESSEIAPKPYRETARVVLLDENNRAALVSEVQYNTLYYITPGGGVESGELYREALQRELLEETGYETEILEQIGSTMEDRASMKLRQDSVCYICRTKQKVMEPHLTEKEKRLKATLVWFDDIDSAIDAIEKTEPNHYKIAFMRARELAILRHAKNIIESKYAK